VHPIAATVGNNGRKDIFWIDRDFGVRAARFRDQARVLGGKLVTAPAALASLGRRPIVSDPDVRAAAPPPPGPFDQRLDVFGVGADYTMLYKTLWNEYVDDPSAWQSLGGRFASTPAVISTGDGHTHLFGVGDVDRALYRRIRTGETWTVAWERLGGRFSSEPVVISTATGQLDVFVRGADFTLRHRALVGSQWTTDWQNLGGTLASAPAVISPSPGRLDVVAVGHDGALWHRWQEAGFWNEWESLGGNFSSAPAAISLAPGTFEVFAVGLPAPGGQDPRDHRHPVSFSATALRQYSYGGNAWGKAITLADGVRSAPAVVSTAAGLMDVFAITGDRKLLWKQWNKVDWEDGTLSGYAFATDGPIECPSRYQFSIDLVRVDTARTALGADTDTVASTVGAGNWPIQAGAQFLDDLGGLTTPSEAPVNQVHFEFECELCDSIVVNYTVVNKGGSSTIIPAMTSELETVLGNLSDHAKTQILPEFTTGEGVVVDDVFSQILGTLFTATGGPIAGTLATWLTSQLTGLVFANCDGPVATAMMIISGQELLAKTVGGTYATTTTHHTKSPTGCRDSTYHVSWSLKR
jgi:hypothetical protein